MSYLHTIVRHFAFIIFGMKENTLRKIQRKTGKKVSFCKCNRCKTQCFHPCLPTPEDVEKLINNGFGDKLMLIDWTGALNAGWLNKSVLMITPKLKSDDSSCIFFENGLCQLHDLGLKPTEGKLSHHSTTQLNFNPKKSIGLHVAKEWIDVENNYFSELIKKINSN